MRRAENSREHLYPGAWTTRSGIRSRSNVDSFFLKMEIFEQRRSASACFERIIGAIDFLTIVGRHLCASPFAIVIEAVIFGLFVGRILFAHGVRGDCYFELANLG